MATLRNEMRKKEPESKSKPKRETHPKAKVQEKLELWLGKIFRFLAKLLSGRVFDSVDVSRVLPFTSLIFFLLLFYITNTYMAEIKSKKIVRLEKSIQVKRNEYVSLSAKTTNMMRQSSLISKTTRMGLKPCSEPVKRINWTKQ